MWDSPAISKNWLSPHYSRAQTGQAGFACMLLCQLKKVFPNHSTLSNPSGFVYFKAWGTTIWFRNIFLLPSPSQDTHLNSHNFIWKLWWLVWLFEGLLSALERLTLFQQFITWFLKNIKKDFSWRAKGLNVACFSNNACHTHTPIPATRFHEHGIDLGVYTETMGGRLFCFEDPGLFPDLQKERKRGFRFS